MGVRFACHVCGKRLNIKQELAGKRGVCPACASKIRIPLTDTEVSTPVDQKPWLVDAVTPAEPAGGVASATVKPAPAKQRDDLLAEHAEDATWYVRPPSGGQYGPATTDLLKQWIGEGRVTETSLLWRDGWPQWRTASETLPEMVGSLPAASGVTKRPKKAVDEKPPQPASPSTPSESPHIVAADRDRPSLSGQSTVGATRRERSSKRVLMIGVLSAVALLLIGVLIVLASLG